jgi:hypothetical protein
VSASSPGLPASCGSSRCARIARHRAAHRERITTAVTIRTASPLQHIQVHRTARPMREGPYGRRRPTKMAARRRPPASPSSQEVTICSSDSSCWWPWGPPSSPARHPAAARRVPRSILRRRSTVACRARCRVSPRRRRDLARHASRRNAGSSLGPGVLMSSGIGRLHAVVTRRPPSVVRRLDDERESGPRTRDGQEPQQAGEMPAKGRRFSA